MTEKCVRLEVNEKVALVTLDRPPVNALSRDMRYQRVATFDEISARGDIMCAVLTGNGSVFCAGAALKDRPRADVPGDFLEHNRITRETTNAIRECTKPVIAAVNGAALGAGLAAALQELAQDGQPVVSYGNDEMVAALALWQQWSQDPEGCLRTASHGQRLIGLGDPDADFACCAAVDSLEIVPMQAEAGVLRAS